MIAEPDDIFWLTGDEVDDAAARLDRGEMLDSLAVVVPQRKADLACGQAGHAAHSAAPNEIPGLGAGKLRMARRQQRGATVLKGVAASPGTATGLARVLDGPEDFGQMQAGEVLVAAITTPAWTPLFARALAVVTDVGGPLSHGSIVRGSTASRLCWAPSWQPGSFAAAR